MVIQATKGRVHGEEMFYRDIPERLLMLLLEMERESSGTLHDISESTHDCGSENYFAIDEVIVRGLRLRGGYVL